MTVPPRCQRGGSREWDETKGATVLQCHRHEPSFTITTQSGVKIEIIICPCKVCGKLMEFPVEAKE